jgi:hypothetical protein
MQSPVLRNDDIDKEGRGREEISTGEEKFQLKNERGRERVEDKGYTAG